jgi:hypothetical protein
MLVDVSWNEVIKPAEVQLNNLLRKAMVYPQLLYSCQSIAQKLRLLKTLKEKGAEPVLFDPACEKSYSIHGIERRYWRLYKLCDAYRFRFYNINNEIIAASKFSHRKMTVGVRLGERQPFLPFSTDPLKLTPQEFRKLLKEISDYCKEVGIRAEVLRGEWKCYDEFFAVTLRTGINMHVSSSYRNICYIHDFAEEYDWIIAPSPEVEWEERNKNEEELRDYYKGVVSRMEKLIGMCNTFESLENVTVYKTSVPLVEKTFNLQLADVADMALVVKSNRYVLDSISLSPRLPLNYLVAKRILEERGVQPSFMMPDEDYKGLFPKPLGISVHFVPPHVGVNLYSLLIYPKPANQLPRIRKAKVIKTRKRIVVVSP